MLTFREEKRKRFLKLKTSLPKKKVFYFLFFMAINSSDVLDFYMLLCTAQLVFGTFAK